jgi:hypothetical protein
MDDKKGQTNVVEDLRERRDVRQGLTIRTNKGCYRHSGRYDKILCSFQMVEGLQEGKEIGSVILWYDIATNPLPTRILPAMLKMSDRYSQKRTKSALEFNPIELVLRDGIQNRPSKGSAICRCGYGRREILRAAPTSDG